MRKKPEDRKKAIQLRKKGESYREIARALGVAKSSVSAWCKDMVLSSEAQKILQEKTNVPFVKLRAYNQKRSLEISKENSIAQEDAIREVSFFSRRELALVGAALYWGEGYKKQDTSRSPYVGFSNSDPDMVRLFLYFLKGVLRIPTERIKCDIRVFPTTKGNGCIDFWSNATQLPREQFSVSRYVSRSSKGSRPFHAIPNGTLSVRVYDRRSFFKIKGYIMCLRSFVL